MSENPEELDLREMQDAMQHRQSEVEAQQRKLQSEAMEQLEKLMDADAEVAKLGQTILFGHRLTHWAAAKMSERSDVSALMIGVLNELQRAGAAKTFDFVEVMKEFNSGARPWLTAHIEKEDARKELRESRLKAITTHVKSKRVPLPLGLDRKFENGMDHGEMFPLFSHSACIPILMNLFAKEYAKAGGNVILLAGPGADKDRNYARTYPYNVWSGRGDTVGQLLDLLKDSLVDKKPFGLLLIDSLDNLIADVAIESRFARLVRAFAVIQQLQSIYPTAAVVGINMSDDKPQGMRPQESYPPYLSDRPHVWADLKKSELAGGTVNVHIDTDIYTVPQLQKMTIEGV